ncbi:hypothetical protein BGZ63DRAFT_404957 [Mariannaea sp. PMI_226]|nr:hypothetical protein BGZ63DRAFT_404957 [Mariannaea sp. PMI_226]
MVARSLWSALPLLLLATSALADENDFSFYPRRSQSCLYNSANTAKCTSGTAVSLNECLCYNHNGFVTNAAACVGRKAYSEVYYVYRTMIRACNESGTPLSVSRDDFQAAAEAGMDGEDPTTAPPSKTTSKTVETQPPTSTKQPASSKAPPKAQTAASAPESTTGYQVPSNAAATESGSETKETSKTKDSEKATSTSGSGSGVTGHPAPAPDPTGDINSEGSKKHAGLSSGAILGIGIGIAGVAAIGVGGLIVFFLRRRRRRNEEQGHIISRNSPSPHQSAPGGRRGPIPMPKTEVPVPKTEVMVENKPPAWFGNLRPHPSPSQGRRPTPAPNKSWLTSTPVDHNTVYPVQPFVAELPSTPPGVFEMDGRPVARTHQRTPSYRYR